MSRLWNRIGTLALVLVGSWQAVASAGMVDVAVGFNPAISADGSRVYYTTGVFDFVGATRVERDVQLGTTTPAPFPTLPTTAVRGFPVTNPSGRYVAFVTYVGVLPGDTNGQDDVYLLDTVTSVVTRESIGHLGQQGTGGLDGAANPSLSSDGRYLVFAASFSNLVPSDTNAGQPDVFVRDRCVSEGVAVPSCTPTTTLEGLGPAGIQSDRECNLRSPYAGGPSISADGRWITFSCFVSPTAAPAFAPGHTCTDPNGLGCMAVYVRDRCVSNGTPVPACVPATELVSATPGGDFPNGWSIIPAIAGNGTRVLYTSTATDIVPEPPNGVSYDAFLYDRGSATTSRLTEPPPFDRLSPVEVAMSDDGMHAAWALDGVIRYWADCAGIAPVCGNGAVEVGCEECDDGNLVDGDGCDSNCTVTACRNGIVTPGEACDDGNTVEGDGCDSNCTPTSCGNGIRTGGEGCDHGNLVAGDGCSETCTVEPAELTPGGKGKTDCQLELMPYFQPPEVKGLPVSAIVCHDDDPSCDLGSTTGDKTCYFEIALCPNVTDPRIPCAPIDLAGIAIVKPSTKSVAAHDVFNFSWLTLRLEEIGGAYNGRCTKPDYLIGQPCVRDVDCGFSGGKCGKGFFEFLPPVATVNTCSDFARIAVPLRERTPGLFKAGAVTIKLRAFASNDPVTGKPRNLDGDTLKLTCLPSP